jgi:hypothetical protein
MNRFACILLLLCSHVAAQQPPSSVVVLANGIGRIEGKEITSGIAYTRLFVTGTQGAAVPGTVVSPSVLDLSLPTLTAQCTQAPNGKLRFELFVNFGGISDTAFYPPWSPANSLALFPPRTEKVNFTMEFLGYTKVKPVKRQYEKVLQPEGQFRYNSPSSGSSNMEEIAYYMQYLRALPTFHIGDASHTATFLTTPLLAQIHNEPLCRASGL